MTTNELKDAAIFVMAYSFLKMDSTEELGLFINKKASKFIDELLAAMFPIVEYYHEYRKRIDIQTDALSNKAPILAEFYACNKEKIMYIANKSYDTKYRKEAEDSQRLAYFYIENI